MLSVAAFGSFPSHTEVCKPFYQGATAPKIVAEQATRLQNRLPGIKGAEGELYRVVRDRIPSTGESLTWVGVYRRLPRESRSNSYYGVGVWMTGYRAKGSVIRRVLQGLADRLCDAIPDPLHSWPLDRQLDVMIEEFAGDLQNLYQNSVSQSGIASAESLPCFVDLSRSPSWGRLEEALEQCQSSLACDDFYLTIDSNVAKTPEESMISRVYSAAEVPTTSAQQRSPAPAGSWSAAMQGLSEPSERVESVPFGKVGRGGTDTFGIDGSSVVGGLAPRARSPGEFSSAASRVTTSAGYTKPGVRTSAPTPSAQASLDQGQEAVTRLVAKIDELRRAIDGMADEVEGVKRSNADHMNDAFESLSRRIRACEDTVVREVRNSAGNGPHEHDIFENSYVKTGIYTAIIICVPLIFFTGIHSIFSVVNSNGDNKALRESQAQFDKAQEKIASFEVIRPLLDKALAGDALTQAEVNILSTHGFKAPTQPPEATAAPVTPPKQSRPRGGTAAGD